MCLVRGLGLTYNHIDIQKTENFVFNKKRLIGSQNLKNANLETTMKEENVES